MKLSKKSRYGIRALIDLMNHAHGGQITLASIAERNNISGQYLEQVFAGLRRGGIVNSVKGPMGGYFLAESPDKITLAAVIAALEGGYRLEDEVLTVPHDFVIETLQEVVIDGINREMEIFLNSISLADLQKNYRSRTNEDANMYFI